MLVITRKEGEQIQIGEGVTVTVVRIEKHSIRLGVKAPKEASILRSEIADAVRTRSGLSEDEKRPSSHSN